MELTAFITEHSRRKWESGQIDCLLTLADWAVWLGFDDFAAHLRGTYSGEDGARTMVERFGGCIPAVASCFEPHGFGRTGTPSYGDISVIGSRSDIFRQHGAIFDGSLWVLRGPDGFLTVRAKPLAIWKIL